MRFWLFALLLLPALASAMVATDDLTPEQLARYRELTHELRCLVCQNQTISDSNAPLAEDLRAQVHAQILAGRSNDEIRDYMTARYGDFVLYKPPLKAKTVLLWSGPFVLLLIGLFAVWRFARRTPPAAAPPVDAAAVQRLLDDEARR